MTDTVPAGLSSEQLQTISHGFGFAQYQEWLRHDGRRWRSHAEPLYRNYTHLALTDAERRAVEGISERLRILALVDAGCPDVIANLPIVARISEMSPRIELRILHRPDHWDIADAIARAHPGPGKDFPGAERWGESYVPTYVLFDDRGNDIAALIERPACMTELTTRRRQQTYEVWAELYPGVDAVDLPAEHLASVLAETIEWRWGLVDRERAGVVEWLVGATTSGPELERPRV